MPSSSSELERASRALKAKRRADSEYRAALVAAHHAGHSYAQLAKALGISRQAVRVIVTRAA